MTRVVKLYLVTNIVNGKQYVGITSREIKRRWQQHLWETGKENFSLLHKAVQKYGRENFIMQQIASAFSWEDACEIEKLLIKEYKTFRPMGYNFTEGGAGTLGYQHSEEAKAKIGKGHTGLKYKLSDEERKRRSESMKARRNTPNFLAARRPLYARQWTEEARKKVSETHKGVKESEETRKKLSEMRKGRKPVWSFRPVICHQDGLGFESIAAAARHYGAPQSSIRSAVREINRTVRGLSFSYLNPKHQPGRAA